MERARERGFITYSELNAVLPADAYTSREIEGILEMLMEYRIDVVEG